MNGTFFLIWNLTILMSLNMIKSLCAYRLMVCLVTIQETDRTKKLKKNGLAAVCESGIWYDIKNGTNRIPKR